MIGRALKRAGVLGMNRRNISFIQRYNQRKFYPRVDDKLITKRMLTTAGIPVPMLIGEAEYQFQLARLIDTASEHPRFALKPARGAMGNGIVVIKGREGELFVRAGGGTMSRADIRYHASGILSGLYSLGGHTDAVMIEEALTVHPELVAIAHDGVPDIRIIVFRGIPVMSMIRLPTRASRGRANLHQGAVGAGIDLHTGRTNHAVIKNQPTTHHPDSEQRVIGRSVPGFATALEIATRAADETELGYVGADVVVDANYGPVILELNARPGLAIQIANRCGLLHRLNAVEAMTTLPTSLEDRIAVGREIAERFQPKVFHDFHLPATSAPSEESAPPAPSRLPRADPEG